MCFGSVVHAEICFDGHDGAEGELVVGVPETPDHFKLFDRELGYFFEVEVGGQGFDAGATCI